MTFLTPHWHQGSETESSIDFSDCHLIVGCGAASMGTPTVLGVIGNEQMAQSPVSGIRASRRIA
jgi:hypothetical protein